MLRILARKKLQIFAAIGVCAIAVAAVTFSLTGVSKAEENNQNMAALLRTLDKQIVEAGRGQISLHFISPIEGIVSNLDIPGDMIQGNQPRYEITQIGDDFMCYQDDTGDVYFDFCVPFTNIASISYTVPPGS